MTVKVKFSVIVLLLVNAKLFSGFDGFEVVGISKDFWGSNDDFRGDFEGQQKTLNFRVFDKSITLNLQPNHKLLSPFLQITKKSDENNENLSNLTNSFCHFLHVDDKMAASVSSCVSREINGIVFLEDSTLEIHPLTNQLKELLQIDDARSDEVPHIVMQSSWDVNFLDNENIDDEVNRTPRRVIPRIPRSFQPKEAKFIEPNVEIAIFFDEAAYKKFSPYFEFDDKKLRDMILAYINNVQALYHHQSLGRKIDFTIVYMEIMAKQKMAHANGERNDLLDNFCDYQKKLNPPSDKSPGHWDLALYISGLDFFAWETNGRKSSTTMGLATVGGVCLVDYACIIAEFGAVNIFGKPYPSSGFTAVYILAHEIGHSLGMHHDATSNSCFKDGYIMSPSRGTEGETTWSRCSADAVRNIEWAKCLFDEPLEANDTLDPWKFRGYPGITYTAKMQCDILLTDRDAFVFANNGLRTICQNLHCRTPHRSGYYFAGPALQGTECGNNMWCEGGGCVVKKMLNDVVKPVPGGWSPWKKTKCKSACLEDSQGYQLRRRECNNPVPVNTDKGCSGPAHGVFLCDDKTLCSKRHSIEDYASEKCREFSTKITTLDEKGAGLQATYESSRLWMSCAIFCRRKDSNSYYTPRIELNDLGISPYFPDGTWCHVDDHQENYYCQQHHCLPESFKITKGVFPYSDDIPGNAINVSQEIVNYFSLTIDRKPVSTHIKPEIIDKFINDEQLTDKE